MAAAALEQFVNNVRSLSSQGKFSELAAVTSRKSFEMLARNAAHLDTVLATLDLQTHSLGYMAILTVRLGLPDIQDFELLFLQVQQFLDVCNGEQVRFGTDTYAELCHRLTIQLIERKMSSLLKKPGIILQPMRGISILQKAIQKIQIQPSQLTSIHADLCQLALVSKCLKPAIQILAVDVTDISKENGYFDSQHFLLYYYYGGMIYTAVKNYERALHFFEIAITLPASAVSHIMLEAFKKHLLVSLIHLGRVYNLPKWTSLVVHRYIKPLCQPYNELVSAYATDKPSDVNAVVLKHSEVFTKDTNMGLVKQVVQSLYRKNIQRLTKTFLTLSLADMANRVELSGPQEAERYMLQMIDSGSIFASIDQKKGMVYFHDNAEKYNTPSTLRTLDGQMQRCMELNASLVKMDQEISHNPRYVQKVISSSSHTHDDDGSKTIFPLS